MLELLTDGPCTVGELAASFDMRRPSVSEHLRVLREAGLVGEHREGRYRIYSLRPEALTEVATWLHPFERFWRSQVRSLAATLEKDAGL